MVPSYKELIANIDAHRVVLAKERPELMGGFQKLMGAAEGAGGALDAKTKELIALALAVGVRCDPCIGMHTRKAVALGVTRAELEDMLGVCITMGGGPALMYACGALAAYEELGGEKTA